VVEGRGGYLQRGETPVKGIKEKTLINVCGRGTKVGSQGNWEVHQGKKREKKEIPWQPAQFPKDRRTIQQKKFLGGRERGGKDFFRLCHKSGHGARHMSSPNKVERGKTLDESKSWAGERGIMKGKK